jgi:hypothetical protein
MWSSLGMEKMDKRLTDDNKFIAGELGDTIHQKKGENENLASSVVHWGCGVAEKIHDACV